MAFLKKEPDFVVLLTVLLVTSPITAIVNAIVASKLWSLLVASQYGAGPTLQTWCGISVLFAWLSNAGDVKDIDKEDDQSWAMWTAVKVTAHAIYGGLLLVLVGLIRLAFGWS